MSTISNANPQCDAIDWLVQCTWEQKPTVSLPMILLFQMNSNVNQIG